MRLRFYLLIERIKSLFTFEDCYKERMGYTCRHRVYKDGTKECGDG